MNDIEVAKKLVNKYGNAHDRSIPCTLSIKRMRQLLSATRCYYTGELFNPNDPNKIMTIDRVDNSKGYHDDNVVPCIADFNRKKSNLSLKEIENLYKKIQLHSKKQKK